MIKRWFLYLAVVSGCAVFHGAYQQWFSWLILLGIGFVPVVSLLMSLPAMVKLSVKPNCPGWLTAGELHRVELLAKDPLPVPEIRCRVRTVNTLTGRSVTQEPGQALPAEHCGRLICTVERGKIYDYLGLFRLRIGKKAPAVTIVRPVPLPMTAPVQAAQRAASHWRPKPGGGFSERHDLRLYRPGDSLNQVHWKLSAKTGKLILREPMIQADRRMLLEMELQGSPEELDRKLGRLLWLSLQLLEQDTEHELRVLTGSGVLQLPVSDENALYRALDELLCQPKASEGQSLEPITATWQYRIGGGQEDA